MRTKKKLHLVELMIVVVIILTGVLIMSIFLSKDPDLFYRDRPAGLCEAALPDKPNWVSSLVARDDKHYIAPLPFTPLDDLKNAIHQMDPKAYVVIHDNSLEGFHRTKFFGFTDWFCIKDDGNITATATLGYSDMGYNRRWVEQLRAQVRGMF